MNPSVCPDNGSNVFSTTLSRLANDPSGIDTVTYQWLVQGFLHSSGSGSYDEGTGRFSVTVGNYAEAYPGKSEPLVTTVRVTVTDTVGNATVVDLGLNMYDCLP